MAPASTVRAPSCAVCSRLGGAAAAARGSGPSWRAHASVFYRPRVEPPARSARVSGRSRPIRRTALQIKHPRPANVHWSRPAPDHTDKKYIALNCYRRRTMVSNPQTAINPLAHDSGLFLVVRHSNDAPVTVSTGRARRNRAAKNPISAHCKRLCSCAALSAIVWRCACARNARSMRRCRSSAL